MAKYRLTSGEYFEGKIETISFCPAHSIMYPEMYSRSHLEKITRILSYGGLYILVIRYYDVDNISQLVYDTANHPFTERAYKDSRIIYENTL